MESISVLAQNADAGAGLGIGMLLIVALMGLIGLIIWVWALIDALRNPSLTDTQRVVWVVVIVFTQILGAIIYLLIGRKTTTPTAIG